MDFQDELKTIDLSEDKPCIIFRSPAILDVTNFNASSPEEPLGYLCPCEVSVSYDGIIQACSADPDKKELERFSVRDIIRGCDNINNYDPAHRTEVSLWTENNDFRFSFQNTDLKKKFWNAVTAAFDTQNSIVTGK